jgi:hypothetical protein
MCCNQVTAFNPVTQLTDPFQGDSSWLYCKHSIYAVEGELLAFLAGTH